MNLNHTDNTTTQFGFATLVGLPNAGKSTIINALVGSKISIVTHKVQTTRTVIRGIVVNDSSQVVIVDTPGITPTSKAPLRQAAHANIAILVVDSKKAMYNLDRNLSIVQNISNTPKALVLNKIDTVNPPSLLAIAAKMCANDNFIATFMISATANDGVEDLRQWLLHLMPKGSWLYSASDITDATDAQLAEEITREHLLRNIHDEIPYELAVTTETWELRKDGSLKIQQLIYVSREAHKKIIVGNKGDALKHISMAARQEISIVLGKKVHLYLFVKVNKKSLEQLIL